MPENIGLEHGLVTIDSVLLKASGENKNPIVNKTTDTKTPVLESILSIVAESNEEYTSEELPPSSALRPDLSPLQHTASHLLDSSALHGLIPRPGTCHQYVQHEESTANAVSPKGVSLFVLDQVPFTIRTATATDIEVLYHLQTYAFPALQNELISEEALSSLIASYPEWQYVAVVGDQVVAAFLLHPKDNEDESNAAKSKNVELHVELVAVHPKLQDGKELFCALASFALQRMLADATVSALYDGPTGLWSRMQKGTQVEQQYRWWNESKMLASFTVEPTVSQPEAQEKDGSFKVSNGIISHSLQDVSETGDSEDKMEDAPPAVTLDGKVLGCRTASFQPGCSLDDLILKVVDCMGQVELPLPETSLIDSLATTEEREGEEVVASLRAFEKPSQVDKIVAEARRLTQMMDLNATGNAL